MTTPRPHVLWFGHPPGEATTRGLEERDLIPSVNPATVSSAEFSTATALVIALGSEPASEQDGAEMASLLKSALRHGLHCTLLAPLARIPNIKSFLRSLIFGSQIVLWEAGRELHVPEQVARTSPGPPWKDTIEVSGEESLRDEDRILLRRAFHDCTTVSLVAETHGRSAQVFCVYARLRDSAAGRLPLPFFAKFDRYPKIRRELKNYHDHTTVFIPFNQRPNLDPVRCMLGAERGLIVGNFVEESETLGALVERGTARAAIHSLFGGALRGWRTQTYFDDTMSVSSSIIDSLPHCLPAAYRPPRSERVAARALAARALGASLSPKQLDALLRQLPPLRHRLSMTHGDLHGANVRVSHDEAILIDFASTQVGPLMADPASLEVSLIMESRVLQGPEWEEFAKEMYELANLRTVPSPRDPARREAPLWNSIRQLRQIALADELSKFEYALTVAIYLLRRASYGSQADEPAGRRPMAYFLAERIAMQLTSELACATAA